MNNVATKLIVSQKDKMQKIMRLDVCRDWLV